PLPIDLLRLTVRGAAVLDTAGTALLGGDFVSTVLPNNVTPAVTLDLQAASDSGVSNVDNLTNDNTPTFTVAANKTGRIEMDYGGDGTADETRDVAAFGEFAFTATALSEGPHAVTARFVPTVGAPRQARLTVTIDTHGPRLLTGPATEQAPLYLRAVRFNEA